MQELIELLSNSIKFEYRNELVDALKKEKEQIVKAWEDGDYAYFYSKETGRDFDNGEDLLEKEKEQIINANRNGRCTDCPFMYSNEDAEQYYNQTYNQNK